MILNPLDKQEALIGTLIHDAPLLLLVLLLMLKLVLLVRLVTLLLVLMMGEMLLLMMMGHILLLLVVLMVRHILQLLLLVVRQILMRVLMTLLGSHFLLLLIAEKLSLYFFERPDATGLNRRRRLPALRRHLVPHGLLTKKLLLLKKHEMLRRHLTHGHDRRIVETGGKLRHGELRHRRDAGRKEGRHRRKSHHVHDGRIGRMRLMKRLGRRRSAELQFVAHFVCQSGQGRLPKRRLAAAVLGRQFRFQRLI